MIGLLQRVTQASVNIEGQQVASIGHGLLVLVGVQRGDSEQESERLLTRLLGYRVFPDADGRMNRNVCQAGGGLLLVPQFTLAADTGSGTRPGFSTAAEPADGERLFSLLLELAQARHAPVAAGRFGADMQVALVNDGPVTFSLEVRPKGS
jgi:D-tyrosyl-tRNA(Tyr) deacylase